METNKNKKKNAKAPNAKKGGMKTVAMDRYLVPSTVSLSSAKKSSTAESSDAATAKKACCPVVLPAVVTQQKERVPLVNLDNNVPLANLDNNGGYSAVGSPAAAATSKENALKRATSTAPKQTKKLEIREDLDYDKNMPSPEKVAMALKLSDEQIAENIEQHLKKLDFNPKIV